MDRCIRHDSLIDDCSSKEKLFYTFDFCYIGTKYCFSNICIVFKINMLAFLYKYIDDNQSAIEKDKNMYIRIKEIKMRIKIHQENKNTSDQEPKIYNLNIKKIYRRLIATANIRTVKCIQSFHILSFPIMTKLFRFKIKF